MAADAPAKEIGTGGAHWTASPNEGPRVGAAAPSLVVLHYTAMASVEAALARLCDPAAAVSAHYLIAEDGRLFALVEESRRAWHAGVSSWRGETDVNSCSIGVELAAHGHDARGGCAPFPEPQMARLEHVLAALLARWSIAPEGVIAHSDAAPGRKIDPGERFDWTRLARQGLARRRPPTSAAADGSADAGAFRAALAAIGYGDWPDAALRDAFRRRWRPDKAPAAPLDAADLALARALAPGA